MTGPVCPRCGGRATGLRSSKHIWQVLPCGEWLTPEQAAAVRAAAEAKAAAA